MIAVLVNGGFAHLVAAGQGEEARGLAAEALDRWVRSGLPHGIDADAARRFDPAEVINGFKWAALQGQDDFWRECWIATGRRLTTDFAAQDPGEGAAIRASLTRRFDLAAAPDDAELLLRAPAPLAGPDHALTDFDPRVAEPVMGRVEVSDGRITARLRRGSLDLVTLGWSATLAPAAPESEASVLSPEDAELYLRPAEGLIQVGPRIRELAALWADGLGGWDAALAFRRGIGASFCLGVVGYESFDARGAMDWVLDHGWFDCVLGSALLVSLCRAGGLPARLVGGHFLYPLGPSNHTWAEVWVRGRGWRAADLAGWDLSAGDADADWQGSFTGRIDRRMVTERPPRRVMGPMSLRLPPAWRVLQSGVAGGLEIRVVDAASGRTAFTDRVRVEPGPAAPP